jgi:hypothetical protein
LPPRLQELMDRLQQLDATEAPSIAPTLDPPFH